LEERGQANFFLALPKVNPHHLPPPPGFSQKLHVRVGGRHCCFLSPQTKAPLLSPYLAARADLQPARADFPETENSQYIY